jgi:hypothetical protein
MGRHDELVDRPGGLYSKLYALQLFGDERSSPQDVLEPEPESR